MQSNCLYKVVIADDHEIVRHGVRFILEDRDDICVEAEVASFTELMEVLDGNIDCDLVILDLNLGDNSGIETISKVHKEHSGCDILVLSMYPEEPYALQSIKAGAKGYVSKGAISDELYNAINDIRNGKRYVNKSILDNLPLDSSLDDDIKIQNPLESLSNREYEVYSLLSEGLAYKDIAQKLNLSPKTISTYRSRILEKLSLSNTNQLIQFASANKLGKI